jgi:hypothetical protein
VYVFENFTDTSDWSIVENFVPGGTKTSIGPRRHSQPHSVEEEEKSKRLF